MLVAWYERQSVHQQLNWLKAGRSHCWTSPTTSPESPCPCVSGEDVPGSSTSWAGAFLDFVDNITEEPESLPRQRGRAWYIDLFILCPLFILCSSWIVEFRLCTFFWDAKHQLDPSVVRHSPEFVCGSSLTRKKSSWPSSSNYFVWASYSATTPCRASCAAKQSECTSALHWTILYDKLVVASSHALASVLSVTKEGCSWWTHAKKVHSLFWTSDAWGFRVLLALGLGTVDGGITNDFFSLLYCLSWCYR